VTVQYPQQPPQYPPQQPPAQYPPTYVYPPQQSPPAYGYPQQPPAYPPQPVQPLANASLDDFVNQPTTGEGASIKWMDTNRQPRIGLRYMLRVARPIRDADVRQQTNQAGAGLTFRDGRPKLVMLVPVLITTSPEFPEGKAVLWVKGQMRDELARAMAEAGATGTVPEANSIIDITLIGTRPVPGMNPAFQFRIAYTRPDGMQAAPTTAEPTAMAQVAAVAQQGPLAEHVVQQAPPPAQPGVPVAGMQFVPPVQPAPQAPPAEPTVSQSAPPVAPPPVVGPPQAPPAASPTLTPEQAALMAQLAGQQAQQ
jgi:hypothetical protein